MGILTNFAQSSDYFNSSYSTSSTVDSATAAAILIATFGFILLFTIIMYVVTAIFLMQIFKKAGIEKPWAAWVPIYNNWKMLEIGGQQGFWAVLAIIPLVNIVSAVFMIIAMYNIGLKLGKEGIFVLLALFLPIVWIIWLALDKSTWDETKGAPSLTPVTGPTAPAAAPTYTPPTPPSTPTV